MTLDAEALTELSADKTWGLARIGPRAATHWRRAQIRYQTRWTATLVKDSDGKWRLRASTLARISSITPSLREADRDPEDGVAARSRLDRRAALGFVFGRRKK